MIVDIIILIIIVGLAFIGYKKGLTGSIMRIASLLISIIISIVLYRPISNFIVNNTPIGQKVENAITKTFINTNSEEVEDKDTVPNAVQNYLNKVMDEAKTSAGEVVTETVAKTLSEAIIRVCTLITLIIITNIIILLIRLFTNVITDLPIVKQADEIGGIAYGIIEGILIIYVIFTIFSFVNVQAIKENISKSFIGNAMYNNNIILSIFFK